MATVRKIDNITPISGADAIECVHVGGWPVVVKKGEYSVGDVAIFCEIDSWIPEELAPFLSKGGEAKVYEGIKGNRLRTVKLRGQISQGLLIPINNEIFQLALKESGGIIEVGKDVSEMLGIVKWEPTIPAQLRGHILGSFPSFIPKTDQERVQNLQDRIPGWEEEAGIWEITEKLDGSSCTVYYKDGHVGVCSRNLELNVEGGDTFWSTIIAQGIPEILRGYGRNIALQGELLGPGIQGNKYQLTKHTFVLFDIFDIDSQTYLLPFERYFRLLDVFEGIEHVPIIGCGSLNRGLIYRWEIPTLLTAADGESAYALRKTNKSDIPREGLVFKSCNSPGTSFKVISNEWLLRTGD